MDTDASKEPINRLKTRYNPNMLEKDWEKLFPSVSGYDWWLYLSENFPALGANHYCQLAEATHLLPEEWARFVAMMRLGIK